MKLKGRGEGIDGKRKWKNREKKDNWKLNTMDEKREGKMRRKGWEWK
jgi:hypothetical protein